MPHVRSCLLPATDVSDAKIAVQKLIVAISVPETEDFNLPSFCLRPSVMVDLFIALHETRIIGLLGTIKITINMQAHIQLRLSMKTNKHSADRLALTNQSLVNALTLRPRLLIGRLMRVIFRSISQLSFHFKTCD